MELDKNFDTEFGSYYTVMRPARVERVARLVSAVTSPPLLAMAGIMIGAQTIPESSAWLWAAMIICLSVFPPVLYVMWLVRAGKVTNFHLDDRDQRRGPLLLILLNTIVVWTVLIMAGAPSLLIKIAAAGFILSVMVFMVTLRWKISAHCAAAGGLVALSCMLFGQGAVLMSIIVPVVAWSRVHLRSHTLSQTVAGAILGSVIFALTIYIAQ